MIGCPLPDCRSGALAHRKDDRRLRPKRRLLRRRQRHPDNCPADGVARGKTGEGRSAAVGCQGGREPGERREKGGKGRGQTGGQATRDKEIAAAASGCRRGMADLLAGIELTDTPLIRGSISWRRSAPCRSRSMPTLCGSLGFRPAIGFRSPARCNYNRPGDSGCRGQARAGCNGR